MGRLFCYKPFEVTFSVDYGLNVFLDLLLLFLMDLRRIYFEVVLQKHGTLFHSNQTLKRHHICTVRLSPPRPCIWPCIHCLRIVLHCSNTVYRVEFEMRMGMGRLVGDSLSSANHWEPSSSTLTHRVTVRRIINLY